MTEGEVGLEFHLYYRPPRVATTMLANVVGAVKFSAICADSQLLRLQRVMCTPPVSTTLGMFAFWQWSHLYIPVISK